MVKGKCGLSLILQISYYYYLFISWFIYLFIYLFILTQTQIEPGDLSARPISPFDLTQTNMVSRNRGHAQRGRLTKHQGSISATNNIGEGPTCGVRASPLQFCSPHEQLPSSKVVCSLEPNPWSHLPSRTRDRCKSKSKCQ